MEKRYIQTFSTRTDVQSALDNNELGKPYVALVDGYGLDWNGLDKNELPSNTFLCNYNAKSFNSATTTILKTEGQLFNEDLVLTAIYTFQAPGLTFNTNEGYISIRAPQIGPGGYSMQYSFQDAGSNIFNRYNNETGRSLTIIYKSSSTFGDNDDRTLLGNRRLNDYNYMVRASHIVGSTSYFDYTPTESPAIISFRVFSDGTAERKCITTNQIETVATFTFGSPSRALGFLCGYGSENMSNTELFLGDFYWLYVSNETLTDAEVAKVIRYNENL